MDLLFKRYASPFLLLDGMIESCRFFYFVKKFVDTENEEKIYELWIHKVHDKTYQEFKEQVMPANPQKPVNLGATIRESENILNSFVPA